MNRIRTIILGIILFIAIPVVITASTIWMGYEVYHSDKIGDFWGISDEDIQKVTNPGAVYNISDLSGYSAYISNRTELIGKNMKDSFYWYNKSRLGYVKLIKVKPGQEISFLFSAEKYVYCAEYDKDFKLLVDGSWLTTGDKHTLNGKTEWIMMVFRNATGDLSAGAGQNDEIKVADIQNLTHKYLILEPFTYTFNLNGGSYKGSSNSFTMKRLGVTSMTLPIPTRTGYAFAGWKAGDGQIYSGAIPVEYNQTLFGHASLDAVWSEVLPSSITLNKSDIVLEENSDESVQLTATISPQNALNKTITWSSSDTSVATVTGLGVVKPHKPGKAVITARSANGITGSCIVYVMGFQISLPEYCALDECYEIKVEVFYNGSSNSEGRKRILLNTDNSVELVRVGDEDITCKVLCETAAQYGGNYNRMENNCIVDTMESVSVFYRLKAEKEPTKNGDYEGKITFNVSVK